MIVDGMNSMSKRESWIRKNRKMPFKLYKPNGTEIVPVLLDEKEEDEFIDKWELIEEIVRDQVFLSRAYGIEVDIKVLMDEYGLEGSRDKLKEILNNV